MAYAGVQGAIYNVRINLPHTKDPEFIARLRRELGELLAESKAACEAVQQSVENSFGAEQ
jgi:formiminotetrahydrofolate cyclodeaminase